MHGQSLTTEPVGVAYEFTRREYVATAFAVARLSAPLRIITGVGAAMVAADMVLTLLGGSGGSLIVTGLLLLAWAAFCGVGIPLWRWRSDRLIRGRHPDPEAGLRRAGRPGAFPAPRLRSAAVPVRPPLTAGPFVSCAAPMGCRRPVR